MTEAALFIVVARVNAVTAAVAVAAPLRRRPFAHRSPTSVAVRRPPLQPCSNIYCKLPTDRPWQNEQL